MFECHYAIKEKQEVFHITAWLQNILYAENEENTSSCSVTEAEP